MGERGSGAGSLVLIKTLIKESDDATRMGAAILDGTKGGVGRLE